MPDWARATILQTWPMHLPLPGWPSPLSWCSSDGRPQPGQSQCLLLLETQRAHQAPRSLKRRLYQPQLNRLSPGVCREAAGCRSLMPGHSSKAPSPLQNGLYGQTKTDQDTSIVTATIHTPLFFSKTVSGVICKRKAEGFLRNHISSMIIRNPVCLVFLQPLVQAAPDCSRGQYPGQSQL